MTTLLLVYGATGFIGTFFGGSLVARSVRVAALPAALLLAAALVLSTVVGSGMVAGALVVVIWGVAFGLIPVALTGWMMQAVPDAPEAGQALLVSGFQVAIARGALTGGAGGGRLGHLERHAAQCRAGAGRRGRRRHAGPRAASAGPECLGRAVVAG